MFLPATDPSLPVEKQRQCLTCARFSLAASHMFLCGGCGRRGDLRFDDPINQALVPSPSCAGTSVPSSSAGSSAGQFPPSTPKLSARDAEFVAFVKAGRPQPSFAGNAADAPVSLAQAIQEVQRALSASETQQPSEHLLDLIRAGKLRHIGHAIPRPHSVPGKDEHATGTLSLSGDNVVVASKSVPVPVAANAQQFCMALFSTILPALLDKPQALLDWLTLGRTALAFEHSSGSWAMARELVDRTLGRCIDSAREFGSPDMAVVWDLQMKSSASGSTQQQRGAAAPSARNPGACHNWNDGAACRSSPCHWSHVCRTCGSAQHRGPSCPKGDTPRLQRSLLHGSNSGSSVTTKRTTPAGKGASSAAAASAAPAGNA